MSDNRFDDLLGDDNYTEDEAITTMVQLSKTHTAESHAADIVADKVLRGHFRYSPALGWLEWDGRRWDDDDICEPRVVEAVRLFIDSTEKTLRAQVAEFDAQAKDIMSAVLGSMPKVEAETAQVTMDEGAIVHMHGTDDQKTAYFKASNGRVNAKRQADMWLNLLSAGKISSITKLCRGMEGVITRSSAFDSHPDLLNVHNGVVDLRDGALMPHDPDLLLTHLAGGEYKPGAKSALWDKALQAVEPEIVEWFQTRMGQSITGHTPDDDSLVVCAGGGENGKSAVMSAVMRACGTYGRLISHRVLIAQPGQHPTELMDLRGLRFALLEETPEEGRLDTHQLKTTIGTPQITARRMRRDDVTFTTSHTLWVNTNFLPQVDTTDHGTWRRLKAMPWPFRFVKPGVELRDVNDRQGDLTLKPALATNPTVPAAVIGWLVEGARRWYEAERVSPQSPPKVEQASAEWRSQTDVGFLFAKERLVEDEGAFITADVLRGEFEAFLADQGKRPWSAQLFNHRFPESLASAGMTAATTPVKPAKVRQGDTESRPAPREIADSWHGTPAPRPAATVGKLVRMWRGIRFKTETEMQSGHLSVA